MMGIPPRDTICAIATSHHPSAIGIVRVSGPLAGHLADTVFQPRNPVPLPPGRLVLGALRLSVCESAVPQCMLVFFAGPNSYTGEDLCEFHCLGNPLILADLMDELVSGGCRVAEPGEFTRRAWENGKIGLLDAESLNELARSRTRAGIRLAVRQMGGDLARWVEETRNRLVGLISEVEAAIEFGDTDGMEIDATGIATALEEVVAGHEALLRTFSTARAMREGRHLVVVGRPNVGKSTLFNLLAGQDRAIVHAHPGTTRDILRESMEIAGFPVILHDTAGLRTSSPDSIETEGIRRTTRLVDQAEHLILVFDQSSPMDPSDRGVLEAGRGKRCVAILNKSDLGRHPDWEGEFEWPALRVSLRTGENSEKIRPLLEGAFRTDGIDEGPLLATLRQKDAVQRSARSLVRAISALSTGETEEVVAEELRGSASALGELAGEIRAKDVIDRIFSEFCIGK